MKWMGFLSWSLDQGPKSVRVRKDVKKWRMGGLNERRVPNIK